MPFSLSIIPLFTILGCNAAEDCDKFFPEPDWSNQVTTYALLFPTNVLIAAVSNSPEGK